jgi:phage baseplate assembly protein W
MALIKKAQKITQTARTEQIYADFPSSFDIHPNKLDLVVKSNEESVKDSIRNILLTDRGEKLFNPIFGSDIRSLLFENFSPQTESSLREYIETSINNFEPRASLIDVIVSAVPEVNAYTATVVFSVINKTDPVVLELILNRTR